MERRKFIKSCCCAVIGVPFTASLLQSCGAIYYANSTRDKERLVVSKSEFIRIKKNKQVERDYVLLSLMKWASLSACIKQIKLTIPHHY
jgi:hypothetical protein